MNWPDSFAPQGALVGIPGENGLSVEQRKRLTIAVELVANPSVIFMDEPTSGASATPAVLGTNCVCGGGRGGDILISSLLN